VGSVVSLYFHSYKYVIISEFSVFLRKQLLRRTRSFKKADYGFYTRFVFLLNYKTKY